MKSKSRKIKISELFHVDYGNSFELNRLSVTEDGVNFISRTAKNNGVSAKVAAIKTVKPFPSGMITVSLGGTVLEAFLQPFDFYTGYHIFCLQPKVELTDLEKIFYCSCIRANKYRYNYGRQANRTLRDILIPAVEEIPNWISKSETQEYFTEPLQPKKNLSLATKSWEWFDYDQLFDIKKGKRITKRDMQPGSTPCIRPTELNNGVSSFISHKPNHDGNTITVSYNGSVGEAFYQEHPHFSLDDVNVLYPKFKLNKFNALFICTLIRQEKYRFNYGRKWHLERMNKSKIKLPVTASGQPDYKFMEDFTKTLNFSKGI